MRAEVLEKAQQVAVRVLDHELAVAEQDVSPTVPSGFQFEEPRQVAACTGQGKLLKLLTIVAFVAFVALVAFVAFVAFVAALWFSERLLPFVAPR